IVESKGYVALHVLVVRYGAVIASKSYLPSFTQNFELPDILAAFLAQDYLSLLDSNDAPEKILVNISPRDFDKKLKLLVGSKNRKYQAWLKLASENAYEKLKSNQAMQMVLQLKFEALQKVLGLKNNLERIACFDVSHTAGSATVVGVVVFKPTGPAKNEYRIFNIENIEPGDDYAALHQAISRYLESVKILPDVFLIDGGKGQLHTALKAYGDWKKQLDSAKLPDLTFLSIAKDSEYRTTAKARDIIYHSTAGKILELPCDEVSLHFLQQIRDEAHRFALSSHTKRRAKSYKSSLLDDISGIGKKRRMALLKAFQGLAGIESASVADLAKVPGISLPLAEKIHQTLN
ncbi:MAG: helix-hairpin-helix domain-containing protein, partial [Gammaproteobacteria bacterium]